MRRVVEAYVQVAERNIQYIEAPIEQVLSFSVDKRADVRVAPGERLCGRYPVASQAVPALEDVRDLAAGDDRHEAIPNGRELRSAARAGSRRDRGHLMCSSANREPTAANAAGTSACTIVG